MTDLKYRHLDAEGLSLLRDLADMAGKELMAVLMASTDELTRL
ncbi:hypothetical protein [Pseudomonas koreensis]